MDSGARERRLIFAESWWLLYLSVAAVPVQRVLFVVVHMDEKFYVLII